MVDEKHTPEDMHAGLEILVRTTMAEAQVQAAKQGWGLEEHMDWARRMIALTGMLQEGAIRSALAAYGPDFIRSCGIGVDEETGEPTTPSLN